MSYKASGTNKLKALRHKQLDWPHHRRQEVLWRNVAANKQRPQERRRHHVVNTVDAVATMEHREKRGRSNKVTRRTATLRFSWLLL